MFQGMAGAAATFTNKRLETQLDRMHRFNSVNRLQLVQKWEKQGGQESDKEHFTVLRQQMSCNRQCTMLIFFGEQGAYNLMNIF